MVYLNILGNMLFIGMVVYLPLVVIFTINHHNIVLPTGVEYATISQLYYIYLMVYAVYASYGNIGMVAKSPSTYGWFTIALPTSTMDTIHLDQLIVVGIPFTEQSMSIFRNPFSTA